MKFTKLHLAAAAAAIAVLTTGGVASAAVAPGGSPAGHQVAPVKTTPVKTVPPLTGSQVRYDYGVWGDPTSGRQTGAGWLPIGWTKVRLGDYESKYTNPNGIWNLRTKLIRPNAHRKATVDAKLRALRGVSGFTLVSRVEGSFQSSNPQGPTPIIHYTDLTYTYTDGANGTRMVVHRFAGDRGATLATYETAVGGRPQDRAGLNAVTERVSSHYVQLS